MNCEIDNMDVRWLSERELSVRLDATWLTPLLRRKISSVDRGPCGTRVAIGANTIHFLWDPLSPVAVQNASSLPEKAAEWLSSLVDQSDSGAGPSFQRQFKIEVTYGTDDLMIDDLKKLALLNRCTPEEIILRHRGTTWFVSFLGFQPGFAYLEPTPGSPLIVAPRHENPRPRVPGRTIALGGPYCGIYPASGPGGWNLIGTASIASTSFLDDHHKLWQPGDLVEFV